VLTLHELTIELSVIKVGRLQWPDLVCSVGRGDLAYICSLQSRDRRNCFPGRSRLVDSQCQRSQTDTLHVKQLL